MAKQHIPKRVAGDNGNRRAPENDDGGTNGYDNLTHPHPPVRSRFAGPAVSTSVTRLSCIACAYVLMTILVSRQPPRSATVLGSTPAWSSPVAKPLIRSAVFLLVVLQLSWMRLPATVPRIHQMLFLFRL
jgi:hypothetical protein